MIDTKNPSYPLPEGTGCSDTYVSLPRVGDDGEALSFAATVDGEMTAAACRWLADRLDEIIQPKRYVVIAFWPDYGERMWEHGLFSTKEEAKEAWDAYVAEGQDGDILEAEFRYVSRITLSEV